MQQNDQEGQHSQEGTIAHERVSSPGQGVGGEEAPRQSGHYGEEPGAFGEQRQHHPTPDGQVQAGQDQMAAGQTSEKSQMPDGDRSNA
jgi:hypothetical protein